MKNHGKYEIYYANHCYKNGFIFSAVIFSKIETRKKPSEDADRLHNGL